MLCLLLIRVRLRNPRDCSLTGSSVRGILQAQTLEQAAISFSGDLINLGSGPRSLAL